MDHDSQGQKVQNTLKNLQKKLDPILGLMVKLGYDDHLRDRVSYFREYLSLIWDLPFQFLTANELENIQRRASTLDVLLEVSQDIENGEYPSLHDIDFLEPFDAFIELMRGHESYLRAKFVDINGLQDALVELRKNVENSNNSAQESIIKINQLHDLGIRKAAAEEWTSYFDEESQDARKWSKVWLTCSFVFFTLVILVVFHVMLGMPISWFEYEFFETGVISKYVLFSHTALMVMLFTLSLWCGKNYKALKNIEFANRHRVSSLRSFKAIAGAEEVNKIRDTMFLEVVRLVFSQTNSGYISGAESPSSLSSIMHNIQK